MIHKLIHIRSALKLSEDDLGKLFNTPHDMRMPWAQTRIYLLDFAYKGYKYLPQAECENFDKTKGCMCGSTVSNSR